MKEFKVTIRAEKQDVERMVVATSYIKAAAQVLEISPLQVVKVMGRTGWFANMRFTKSTAHLHKMCKVELCNL